MLSGKPLLLFEECLALKYDSTSWSINYYIVSVTYLALLEYFIQPRHIEIFSFNILTKYDSYSLAVVF